MRKKGPEGEEGNKFSANLYPEYFWWSYYYLQQGNLCYITDNKVTVRFKMIMPQWKPKEGTSQDVINRWNQWVHILEYHEEGHRVIGIRGAQRISDALGSFKSDCDKFEHKTNARANELYQKMWEEQVQYDVDTDHGRTQQPGQP